MKSVQELKDKDLKQLFTKNQKFDFSTLKSGQWIASAIRGYDNTTITAWGIFQLEPKGQEGDIIPVADAREFWDACDIVRSHNAAMGFYMGEFL